ncbi:MAG TPA: hypothetical protein VIY52_31335 [Streptosporangiaceae bacterium]
MTYRGLILDFGGVVTTDFYGALSAFCRREGLPPDAVVDALRDTNEGRQGLAAVECGRYRSASGRSRWGGFSAWTTKDCWAVRSQTPGSSDPARWGQRWSYQLTPDGPDATIVTEIYDCSRAPEEERAGMDNGNVWAGAMAETLERLDALCARPGNQPSPS